MKLLVVQGIMSLKTLVILVSAVSLTACVSAPKQDYTHLPYDNAQSEAYNIAKQSNLVKDYWYGSTIKSPLKDFTEEDIQAAETSLRKYRGGNVSLGTGLLSIATGDLTGIISVAGGSVANMAQSDHEPSNQIRLLVELPLNDFSSPAHAEKYIFERMDNASRTVLEKYGKVQLGDVKFNKSKTVYTVDVDDKIIPFGVISSEPGELKGNKLTMISPSLTGKKGQYLTYGVVGDSGLYDNTAIITAPIPFVYSVEVSPIDTVDFYKEYSAQLPEGFYIYVPSFPKTSWNNKKYFDSSFVVPSLFTQGEQYQFIKP
jgi:hypothetical protein